MELVQAIGDLIDFIRLIPGFVIAVGFALAFVLALPHIVRERGNTRALRDEIKRRLTPGPAFDPAPSWAYYAQRLVIEPRLRRLIVAGLTSRIRVCRGPLQYEQPVGANERAWLRSLREDGYAPLEALLSATQVADIHTFLRGKRLRDHRDRSCLFALEGTPECVRLADYHLRDIVDCPHIVELANNPLVLRLAARYIGCKPTISALVLRWSFPRSGAGVGLQAFHRDVDDWRFVKLFVYLTDVDAESGPHVYVRGSHLTKSTIRLRPYSEDDIQRAYGSKRVIAVTGSSGFGFIADTYGIHKGAVPTKHPRLLLQIQYSLLPVHAYRHEPQPYSGATRLDAYINRLILN